MNKGVAIINVAFGEGNFNNVTWLLSFPLLIAHYFYFSL